VPLQVSNQSDVPPAVDRLPLEQLAQVLQYVPFKERLSSCALVHSSWRAAAAEATTEISLPLFRDNSNSLSAWLQSHCSKVRVTKLVIGSSVTSLGLMRLPLIHLQYLQRLELWCVPWESAPASGSSQQPLQSHSPCSSGQQALLQGSALPSLASLTALTRLDLTGASVRLDGLEALTGLKELYISIGPFISIYPSWSSHSGFPSAVSDPDFNSAEALLAAALPKLQHLTRLDLEGRICSSTALAQVSTMQRLKSLDLKNTAIGSLPTMPQSLTQLDVQLIERSPVVFTSSSPHGSPQLTGLQRLILSGAGAVEATLLEGMVGLRQVSLDVQRFAAVSPEAQPLLVFSTLTALEALRLLNPVKQGKVKPAEAAALTTSSHLTYLDLGSRYDSLRLREAHYEAMFPPGRQQQQLQELHCGTALLSSQVNMGWLTGLTSLVLFHRASGGSMQLAAGLKGLTALEDLAELVLNAKNTELAAGVWSSLGALTGLRDLTVECEPPSGQHLLSLTSCQRLEGFSIPDCYSECQEEFVPGFDHTVGLYLEVGLCCVLTTCCARLSVPACVHCTCQLRCRARRARVFK